MAKRHQNTMNTATASRYTWGVISRDSGDLLMIGATQEQAHDLEKYYAKNCPIVVKRIEWRCAQSTECAISEQNGKSRQIEELEKSFNEERKLYMKCMRDIIRHFVPNEEQLEAIHAHFLKLIGDENT